MGTFSLPGGQIAVQAATTAPQPESLELAVTGGTGRSSEAQGVVAVQQISDTRAEITFHLTG